MKKLLAFMLCFGLVCSMGAGLIGCTDKGKPAPAPAKDKDKDKEKDKEKDKDKDKPK